MFWGQIVQQEVLPPRRRGRAQVVESPLVCSPQSSMRLLPCIGWVLLPVMVPAAKDWAVEALAV